MANTEIMGTAYHQDVAQTAPPAGNSLDVYTNPYLNVKMVNVANVCEHHGGLGDKLLLRESRSFSKIVSKARSSTYQHLLQFTTHALPPSSIFFRIT